MWPGFARFFGVYEGWFRPSPAQWWRTDLLVALGSWLGSIVVLQLSQTLATPIEQPLWQQWLFLGLAAAMLIIRRRFPVTTAVVACALLFLGSVWFPILTGQFSVQVLVFIALYSAFAWGRDRGIMIGVAAFVHACLLMWVIWNFALSAGIEQILGSFEDTDRDVTGPLSASTIVVLFSLLINLIYINAAILLGNNAWWSARREALLAEQAELLKQQSSQLADNAVTAERLRIARELHDVVGHHVAAIGVQAGAARRICERRSADDARQSVSTALQHIEDSSRAAVTEMRNLLGTLRDLDTHSSFDDAKSDTGITDAAAVDRSPTSSPGIDGLPALAASMRDHGVRVDVDQALAADIPASAIPAAVGSSLYRIGQEALSNIRAHSTATTARMTLRTGQDTFGTNTLSPFAEIEIIDSGRPRQGTSGTGMGQLGMRERAQSLGGFVDIGPRLFGGYRVRVRVPLHRQEQP